MSLSTVKKNFREKKSENRTDDSEEIAIKCKKTMKNPLNQFLAITTNPLLKVINGEAAYRKLTMK